MATSAFKPILSSTTVESCENCSNCAATHNQIKSNDSQASLLGQMSFKGQAGQSGLRA